MFAARSAISSSGAPSATPAAIAARALVRLWRSAKGKWKRARPAGVAISASVTPSATRCSTASTSPPGPKRSRLGRGAQVGLELARLDRDDRRAVGGQRREDLGLRRRDRLDRAEQLDVDRADVGDHRHLGLGDRRQLGDLAGAAHRHLQHQQLGVRGRFEHGQRQADLGVEVLAVGVDAARQQRPGDVLDRGLADRAGDADDRGAERAAPGARQAPAARPADRRRRRPTAAAERVRLLSLLAQQTANAPWPPPRPRPRRRPRAPRGRTRRRRRARRAGRRRGRPPPPRRSR